MANMSFKEALEYAENNRVEDPKTIDARDYLLDAGNDHTLLVIVNRATGPVVAHFGIAPNSWVYHCSIAHAGGALVVSPYTLIKVLFELITAFDNVLPAAITSQGVVHLYWPCDASPIIAPERQGGVTH